MITFLKDLIKDVMENVGVWISPSKRGEKINNQIPLCLPYIYIYIFFFKFFFFLVKLILVLTKFFINDTVLVRAIVSFFAVTLKFLCCDSC